MNDAAFGDIRAHIEGAVLVACQRMTKKNPVLMVHGKREFQRVVEDMLVIRNPQIVIECEDLR